MSEKRVVSPTVPATGVVRCILSGNPTPGDQLHLYWCDARGGRSTTGTVVQLGQSLADLAHTMVGRSEFPEYFVLASKGPAVTCIVKPNCPPGTLCTETIGSGSVKLTLEE
jgi:hypothetical protein